MNLVRSITKVFSANLLQLVTSIIVGFFVPAALSIDGYAALRTYTFFIGYVGFLHLGFVDGMYIKYGGVNPAEVDSRGLKGEHKVFILSQIAVTAVILVTASLMGSMLWLLIGISALLINGYSFHKMYYQATGQFDKYTFYAYIYSIIYLAANIILTLVLKSSNEFLYCMTTVIANLAVFIVLEIKFHKNCRGITANVDKTCLKNVRVGFFILLGNLSITMFYAIDQWFVKFGLTNEDFAYYSFAVSMLNMVTVLVNAISVTFYNFLANEKNTERIKNIKTWLIILGSAASAGYFVLTGIIELFLPKYEPALDIISISFAAYPYMIVVNAIYVNLYKVEKNEKKYFGSVIKMLIVATVYNSIAMLIWHNSETIALATTLSFITWFVYSMKDFKYLKSDIREIAYLCIALVMFFVCSRMFVWYIGLIIYGIVLVAGVILLYNQLLRDVIIRLKTKVRR